MHRKKRKTGLPPGTPVFTGSIFNKDANITILQYSDETTSLHADLSQIDKWRNPNSMLWIDVKGLSNTKAVEEIATLFKIHSLALEDILDVDQRPKMDEYDEGIFITTVALKMIPLGSELKKEQITIYFGKNFLLSFQEDADDFLANIRDRIINKKGRIRQKGSDFLAYSIIDWIVDNYYITLDYIESRISDIDENLHQDNNSISREVLHDLKIQIIRIRKSIYPMREVINRFIRSENTLINQDTDVFLRDLTDHSTQIAELSETYQDMINSLHDLYQSEISNRMNNVMKILTIISTIFIPLNFIAGIYGMNFDHMPELKWKYGYFLVLGLMASVSIGFLIYFRRKKWI